MRNKLCSIEYTTHRNKFKKVSNSKFFYAFDLSTVNLKFVYDLKKYFFRDLHYLISLIQIT